MTEILSHLNWMGLSSAKQISRLTRIYGRYYIYISFWVLNRHEFSELKTTSGHLLLATYPRIPFRQVRSGMDGCEKLLELCRENGFTIAHSRSHRYGTLVKSELVPRLDDAGWI